MMNTYRRYYSLCSAYSGCQDDPSDPCYGGKPEPVYVKPTPECLQTVNNLVSRFNAYWLNQRVAEQLASSLTQLLFDPNTCASADVETLVNDFASANRLELAGEHKQLDVNDVAFNLVLNAEFNYVDTTKVSKEGFKFQRSTVKPSQCVKCHKRI